MIQLENQVEQLLLETLMSLVATQFQLTKGGFRFAAREWVKKWIVGRHTLVSKEFTEVVLSETFIDDCEEYQHNVDSGE